MGQLTFPGFVNGFEFLLRLINSRGLKTTRPTEFRSTEAAETHSEV